MSAAGVESAFVLGSSSGGYVAQQLAVEHSGRVNALVLVGSPLSLQGRPPFADEVELLTHPIDEEWVRADHRGPAHGRGQHPCAHADHLRRQG